MKFSLVIPCYNEAKNLPLLLARCAQLMEDPKIEVIIVDNGSTDDTPETLSELQLIYPKCCSIRVEQNQGYGYGILQGLKIARGEILGWTHADMQTDPLDFLKGIALFDKHGLQSFVKGKRYGRPLSDVFFTMGMSVFETCLLKTKMWDINAQPTLFSRTFFESWQSPPHDFALDLYAYYQACVQNIPVYRFPVKFGERAHGVSHWNVNWAAKRKFIRRTVDFSLELRRKLEVV
jgi:glycosyltransferase involved in cell wall biosynthesis